MGRRSRSASITALVYTQPHQYVRGCAHGSLCYHSSFVEIPSTLNVLICGRPSLDDDAQLFQLMGATAGYDYEKTFVQDAHAIARLTLTMRL